MGLLNFLFGDSPAIYAQKQTIFDFPSYQIVYMYPSDEKLTKRMVDLIDEIEQCGGQYMTFDVETTGLDTARHQIIQISAVFFDNGVPVKGFQTYVKPNGPIPPRITDLTGITDRMVKNAPDETFACQAFMEFCGEYIANDGLTVAHNINFDWKFLNAMIGRAYRRNRFDFSLQGCDSLDIARAVIHDVPDYKLPTLLDYIGVCLPSHDAFSDAIGCGLLLWYCYQKAAYLNQIQQEEEAKEKELNRLLEDAKQMYANKRWYDAFVSYSKVIDSGKYNVTIITNMGKIYQNMGHPDKAVSWYEDCYKAGWHQKSILMDWAKVLRNMNKNVDELQVLCMALAEYPNDSTVLKQIDKCRKILGK